LLIFISRGAVNWTKGTLAIVMLADLAVLSQDIFTVPNEQLPATESLLTMIDGKIVYSNNDRAKK